MTTPHIRDDKLYFAALLEHRPLYPELNPLSIMYAAAEQDVVALQASRRRYPDAFRDDLGPRIHDLVGLMACKNDWPETLSWALELNFNPFGQVMVIPGRDGADSALITPWLEALEAGSGKVISHLEELRGIEVLRELVPRQQNMITPLMHLFGCHHAGVALQLLDRHPELLEQPIDWHPSADFKLADYVRAYGDEAQDAALRSWTSARAARSAISEISGTSALAVP